MLRISVVLAMCGLSGVMLAQGGGTAAKAPAAAPAAPPLQLHSLDSATQPDPFPPVNPKYFTADSPTVATVEAYLHTMLGYDANRIWRVAAIQKTAAPGVSKVTALVSERGPNAKVLTAIFYVLPDGKHLIAPDPSGLQAFGADPFVDARAMLKARADGPFHGSASKDLELVEFADLQCPHCKDAQPTMTRLAQDFPKAHIVYQNYPLVEIHPYAFQAAAYGVCIARQNNDAFFTYAQAVYDTQAALLPDSYEQTLKNAVTKAGMDPATIATCAASDATKKQVEASVQLAHDLNVEQTPVLSINGRTVPLNTIPYETLRNLIIFQAGVDGVSAAAASPNGNLTLKP